MQHSLVVQQLARYGFWSTIALLILTIAWIGSLALAPVPGTDADAAERIRFLSENEGWHITNFAIVVPMGFIHVPLWFGLAALIWQRGPALAMLAAGFGLIYAPFTVTGYWTQLTTVRGLVDLYSDNPEAAIASFEVFEFSSNFWSLGYGVVVLGYGTWGLAALAVCAGIAGVPYRLARATGILFGVSGAFGILGAIGFVARSQFLELGVLFSGVVYLPALIGAAVLLYQVANGLELDDRKSSPGGS